jgi:hypothetical protein
MKRPHPYIPYDTRADAPRMTAVGALAIAAAFVWFIAAMECFATFFAGGRQ